jgi:hypothetical protein
LLGVDGADGAVEPEEPGLEEFPDELSDEPEAAGLSLEVLPFSPEDFDAGLLLLPA